MQLLSGRFGALPIDSYLHSTLLDLVLSAPAVLEVPVLNALEKRSFGEAFRWVAGR